MNLFHRPTLQGSHLLLGGLILSAGVGLIFDEALLVQPGPSQQEIVSSARLLEYPASSPAELELARAERCTPGFSCGQSSNSRLRVDGVSTMRFSLMLGMAAPR